MAVTSKKKAQKPSKVVKPTKASRFTTSSTKNHRFQPFSERIAKLKIDPVRRRRKAEDREELSDDTATYFGSSLTEWRDLNLTQTFTAFAKEAAPLSDSLPAVLYNEEQIMDLLMVYIEKEDALALEPLLSLLSHFAHDLDVHFEKHFQRAVATIAAVAAKHSDPAVVEWSFTCLAWLFKYLSRLLTPDLRPLYDLMSPYLGRRAQKPFIIRFAAESLSFLVRKAASSYDKDRKPLDLIMGHVLEQCREVEMYGDIDLHRQGVMTIITEAIKGVQNGVHSGGLAVFRSMLKEGGQHLGHDQEGIVHIVTGVLTSLIHHTTEETFRPAQDAVFDYVRSIDIASEPYMAAFSSEILFTISSVRKGSRITDWKRVLSILSDLVHFGQSSSDMEAPARGSIMSALAIGMQSATIDAVIPVLNVFDMIRRGFWMPYFLQFCDLFVRLGRQRFEDFLLPQFQKFVLEQWQGNEDAIFLLLPYLSPESQAIKLPCPELLQDAVLQRISSVGSSVGNDADLDSVSTANIALGALSHVKLKGDRLQTVQNQLLRIVESALENATDGTEGFHDFAMGSCFTALLHSVGSGTITIALWPMMCTASSRFLHLTKFWSNLSRYMTLCKLTAKDVGDSHVASIESSLLQSLSMPSHDVRLSALDFLQSLYRLRDQTVPDLISVATTIESTPISLETSRSISLNIRRLAQGYDPSGLDQLTQKAIPTYCFGLLHLQLSQAWNDAITALGEMAKNSVAEEVIIGLSQKWLEDVSCQPASKDVVQAEPVLDIDSTNFRVVSDFECSNLAKLSAICHQVFGSAGSGRPSKTEQFRIDNTRSPLVSPNAREQVLRVLTKLPSLAEKRSRMLVPVLLRWAGAPDSEYEDEPAPARWSRKDQKALLAVFAKFTNPKVLFKSNEAYAALLNLCANGDVELQQSALKAVLAWKEPAVCQYEEHLTNLLDEARFREEISVFLQNGGDEETSIKAEHHLKLMPVLLRLLYGRAVAGGKHGQGSRRKAVFIALSRLGDGVLGMFVDIALTSTGTSEATDNDRSSEQPLACLKMPSRQQFGMLNMVNDMLETLGSELEPFSLRLMDVVLACAISATRQLAVAVGGGGIEDASLLRNIRQAGVQCLVKLFSNVQHAEFQTSAKLAVAELVSPRLEKFASENLQSVSATLQLLSAWAASPATHHHLVAHDEDLLGRVAELLGEPNAKDEVRIFILQSILDQLCHSGDSSILTQEHVTGFVQAIGDVLRRNPSKELLDGCVSSLTRLADRISISMEAENVVEVCTVLLRKPNKVISPRTKTGLLRTMLPLFEKFDIGDRPQLYDAMSGLFSRLSDPESRDLLSAVLARYYKSDPQLSQVASICQDLNAPRTRLDEADHERREQGFVRIYEQNLDFSLQQWQPLVHNCLFYIRDADDLVNRTSASRALERFIDAASRDLQAYKTLLSSALMPGIEYGTKNQSELVRAEHLRLLGHLVETLVDWPAVTDMTGLTVSGDDEASFFTNILHIQQHRRLRALRRLADEAPKLSASNVVKMFIPLLEHFVFDQVEGDAGRTMADQAITTLGALARGLTWSAFRATFKRYTSYLSSKEDHEKVTLRLLGALVDALSPPSDQSTVSRLSSSTDGRSEIIQRDFLPPLTEYIHRKDESTVDRRMPVAVTIVKLLLLLPEPEISLQLAPVLTDVCQVLRSRSQEARDQTRKSLVAILAFVGPTYLGFILKELRSALQRGYQLHVLSFTVHALLVNSIDDYKPGDLDHCLPELASIIMDDTFGITGQEKDAEEYKSGMKEVKSSKSFDTMELLARVTPIQRLGQLMQPLRSLLSEKINANMLKKIDELLNRLRKGVDQNAAADSRDMLQFCHEIIRQVYAGQSASVAKDRKARSRPNRYLVQMEAANKSKSKGTTTSQTFKLVSFGLNLLRKVLRRHEDLMIPLNLTGFLPIVGDALVQGQDEVQLSAVRLLSTIMSVPLAELETNAPVYVKEAVTLIKTSPSMTTDSAKAALELVTAVLREKRSVKVIDKEIGDVLKALKGDIDEPDRQGIIYKFLRAVLGRKIMVTEVYDIMDEVGKVMVTNPDRNVQESARSAYLQFVMEYPQGKDRWNKQAAFFVENLKYERPAGRRSVMELLHQLLTKLSDDVLAQLAFTLFVALVPVQVSDADPACRQMAGVLIMKLFERANEEQMDTFHALMDKWLQNEANQTIRVAALECWKLRLRLRTRARPSKQIQGLRDEIDRLLSTADMADSDTVDLVTITALQTFEVLVAVTPEVAFGIRSAGIWTRLQTCISIRSTEVQETSAKLLDVHFSNVASASSKTSKGLAAVPLRGSEGLGLSAEGMRQTCYASLRVLETASSGMSEALLTHTVRNLVFLGRCFSTNKIPWRKDSGQMSDDDDAAGDLSVAQYDPSALAHLFNRLSYIIRQDTVTTVSRIAALQCQAALINHVSSIPNLQSVIRPLYLLTDPALPQPPGDEHKNLVDKARELLDAIQKKVGTETYVAALSAARAEAKGRREERRQKRRIDAVSAPERWAREKRKKYETKKAKAKVKGMEARGKRRGW